MIVTRRRVGDEGWLAVTASVTFVVVRHGGSTIHKSTELSEALVSDA